MDNLNLQTRLSGSKEEAPVLVKKPGLSFVEEKPKISPLKKIIKIFLIIIAIVLFIYLFLNLPTIYSQIQYLFNPPSEKDISSQIVKAKAQGIVPSTPQEILQTFLTEAMAKQLSSSALPQISNIQEPKPVETPSEPAPQRTETSSGGGGAVSLGDNVLSIPKIKIKAPVVWNSGLDEQTMLDNLRHGVTHYAGTALPGTGKGPIFISGHSSYYWWDDGKYKKVFANLDRVTAGDIVQINFENTVYTYEVYDKVVVYPDEVDVLTPVNEPVLYLMTCVPVGTNEKRLIVKARQI